MIFEDELTYDRNFPLLHGLVCRSGVDTLFPTWYNPNGYILSRVTIFPGDPPHRYYQHYYNGTSRLLFKKVRGLELNGLYACRLKGHKTVVAGIYRRWDFNGKVASVCMHGHSYTCIKLIFVSAPFYAM